MPKKSRQAHVPGQAKKRKVRRTASSTFQGAGEAVEAEDDAKDSEPAQSHQGEPRPRRRLDMVTRAREGSSVRAAPGQLPVFGRDYLAKELKQIGLISASMFALIIFLAVVLR